MYFMTPVSIKPVKLSKWSQNYGSNFCEVVKGGVKITNCNITRRPPPTSPDKRF